ncbi:MAG TPA: flagellar biosynthetic protein FliO [Acidobacteriaceae bacterium]
MTTKGQNSKQQRQPEKAQRLAIIRGLQSGILRNAMTLFSRAWKFLQAKRKIRSGPKRLRLTETISLGERRFVAVVQVDKCRFLIGGSATNVTLLTELDAVESSRRIRKQSASPYPLAVEKGGAA